MGRPSEDSEPVEVEYDRIVRESRDAKLYETVKFGEQWIPNSVVEDDDGVTLTIKRWFADKKELV